MLVAVMALSLTSCIHKKNEVAVTVGNVKFTSAYYMCALINAKAEAQSKVKENLTDEEAQEEIDYFSEKIDKKSFADWVEDRAVEMLEEIAAYKTACKDNELKLTEEQKTGAEQATAYFWDSYGYSVYFEPNGVSRDTYAKYTEDSYYSEVYFDYLYGKEGTKALKTEDVNKEITDNYIIVDQIQISYEDDATDDDKAANKKTLEDYAADIKSGKKTFIEIYKAHNEIEDEEKTDSDSENEDEEELQPINTYASVLGSEDTNYASDDYATFKDYEIDVPQVIENADKTGVVLVIKRDISKDAYFMDSLDSLARHSIADEDFEKDTANVLKKLQTKVSGYATSQFKVKNIIEPETSY